MKTYVLTFSDKYGEVFLVPVLAKSSQDAVTQGKELMRYGYEGLYVSGYREV